MRAAPPLVLLFAACGSTSSSIKPASYTAEAEFLDPDSEDGEKTLRMTDCFTVKPAAEGALEYKFALHFPYEHMCEMRGTARLVAPGLWEDASQEGCRLVIGNDGKSWTIDDPDSSCRNDWCGARGNIGHSFPLSSAKAWSQCGS